jgi:amidase
VVGTSAAARPAPSKPIRVARVTDPGGQGTAPQVQDAVRKSAAALAASGYAIDDVEPPALDQAGKLLLDMLNPTGIPPEAWELEFRSMPEKAKRFLTDFSQLAGVHDPAGRDHDLHDPVVDRAGVGRVPGAAPLIVAPIYADVPFAAGSDLDDGAVARTVRGMRMATAVNALGLPAVAVPVGIADGLPQVVQIIGPRDREDLCLDAAAAIEQALGIITPIDPR